MRKFNIKLCIMAITAAVLLTASIIVFAAFSYKKNIVSSDVTVGDVTINEKSFLSYAKTRGDYEDSQEYRRLCKLRTDSYAYVEGISINTNYLPVETPSGFSTGVTYYTKNGDTYVIEQEWQSGTQYYNRNDSFSVKTAFDATNTILTPTISGNVITLKKESTTVETLTLTTSDKVISAVTLGDSTNHRYVIGSDGLSVYIFTKAKGESVVATTDDTIICYASERTKNDGRIDYSAPYLNQLGLKFDFTTRIPVYVRIHIQDAWISTQFLSSTSERTRYIPKAQISGASPFSINDPNWRYDPDQNVAYYKQLFTPVKNNEGEYTPQSFVFDVNEGYFYHDTSVQAPNKVTTVQVSFTVDIVQANRAEELWGVDFDTLFA